jgi:hypothetical protein
MPVLGNGDAKIGEAKFCLQVEKLVVKININNHPMPRIPCLLLWRLSSSSSSLG